MFADGTPVRTEEDWNRRRQELLTEWNDLLGALAAAVERIRNSRSPSSERRENFTQHRVRFPLDAQRNHQAAICSSRTATDRIPAVITVYYEPETAIGLGRPLTRDFALQLARRGFVTLSIGTTEATAAKTYGLYHPSLDDAQVQPLSMLGCAAANAWHALANRPDVDAERIGIVGHSFGGKWAMFASCLFDKFACAAWSDPGIVFDEARGERQLLGAVVSRVITPNRGASGASSPNENPALGLYPKLVAAGRDLHELHALMAPRPFLVSGGSEDPAQALGAAEPHDRRQSIAGLRDIAWR